MLMFAGSLALTSAFVGYDQTNFYSLTPPSGTVCSAATNGSWVFYVLNTGAVYLSQSFAGSATLFSTATEMRQVAYSEGAFLFLKQNNKDLYKLDTSTGVLDTCTLKQITLGLSSAEIIAQLAAGPGGFVLLTSQQGFLISTSAGVLATPAPLQLQLASISPGNVRKVQMALVPIFLLKNGSAVAYGKYQEKAPPCTAQPVFNFYLINSGGSDSILGYFPFMSDNLGNAVGAIWNATGVFECSQIQPIQLSTTYTQTYDSFFTAMQQTGYSTDAQLFLWKHSTMDYQSASYTILPGGLLESKSWLFAPTTINPPIDLQTVVGSISAQLNGIIIKNLVRAFQQISTSSLSITSLAIGSQAVYFVSSDGKLYRSANINEAPVQVLGQSGHKNVFYAEGKFFFVMADSNTVFELQGDSFVNITASLGKTAAEVVVFSAGGPGGLFVVTTRTGYWVHGNSTVEKVAIEQVGIGFSQISRVEINAIPVIYLINSTIIAYGTQQNKEFGCSYTLAGLFKRCVFDGALRFMPYAEDRAGKIVSAILSSKGEYSECVCDSAIDSTRFTGTTFEDFYMVNNISMFIQSSPSRYLTLNQPSTEASIVSSLSYHIYPGAADPLTWFLGPTSSFNGPSTPGQDVYALTADCILREPPTDALSAYFVATQAPSQEKLVSVASDGDQMYWVGESGQLYYATNRPNKPSAVPNQTGFKQTFYAAGRFWFLKQDGWTLYHMDPIYLLIPIDMNFKSTQEQVVEISPGESGFLCRTNIGLYTYTFSSSTRLLTATQLPLIGGSGDGISVSAIARIELNIDPVILLSNATAFVYSSEIVPLTVASSATGWRRLTLSNVTQFIPQAGVNKATGKRTYSAISSGKLATWTTDSDKTESSTSDHVDIYCANSICLTVREKTAVLDGTPSLSVSISKKYRIVHYSSSFEQWYLISSELVKVFEPQMQQLSRLVSAYQITNNIPSIIQIPDTQSCASSAATSANLYLAVGEDGYVYKSTDRSIRAEKMAGVTGRQVLRINSDFYLIKGWKDVLYFNPATSVFSSVSLPQKEAAEVILLAEGGSGGAFIVTNASGYWVTSSSGVLTLTQSKLEFGTTLQPEEIAYVRMDVVPVLYLTNGTTVVFGTSGAKEFSCATARQSLALLRQVAIQNVSRFIPYYSTNAAGAVISAYLLNETIYTCAGDETAGTLLQYYSATKHTDILLSSTQEFVANATAIFQPSPLLVTSTNSSRNIFSAADATGIIFREKRYCSLPTPGDTTSDSKQYGTADISVALPSLAYNAHLITLSQPPNVTQICTNGWQVFFLTSDGQLLRQYGLRASHLEAITEISNVVDCGFAGAFYFVLKSGYVKKLVGSKFTDVSIAQTILMVGQGAGQLVLAGKTGFYLSKNKFSQEVKYGRFSGSSLSKVQVEQYGAVFYTKQGAVYYYGEQTDATCGGRDGATLKRVGVKKPRRFIPGYAETPSYVVSSSGKVLQCSKSQGPKDVTAFKGKTLQDYKQAAWLERDRVILPSGEYQKTNGSLLLESGGLLFSVQKPIEYNAVDPKLALGLGIGLPCGIIALGLGVYALLLNKGFCQRRPRPAPFSAQPASQSVARAQKKYIL